MNFTVIPFLLAANVAVNDTNEWIHGPEYIYHVNLTYWLSMDLADEPLLRTNLTTTMRCRPAGSDMLFCRFDSVITTLNDQSPEEVELEHPFMIKFNERGIDSLLFPDFIHNERLNTIRSIVKGLSVGADLRQNAHALPAFVARENSVLGDCATLFTVLRSEDQDAFARAGGAERNYELQMLSLPEQKFNVVVVVKRIDNNRCKKDAEGASYTRQGLNVRREKYIGKMHVSAHSFRIQTEILMKVMKTMGKKYFVVQNTASLELAGIEPAKDALPSLAFEEVASLRYSEGMEHNFLI